MKTNTKWRIIVEPNELMRQGFMNVLIEAGHTNCIGFESVEEMESTLDPEARDGMILANLGSERDKVARGIEDLKSGHPESPIVLLSNRYCHSHLQTAFKAGASGYILTSTSCEALIKSLQVISLGQPVIPEEALGLVLKEDCDAVDGALSTEAELNSVPTGLLSERELVVLRCLCSAMSNKLIARQCNICEATVKVHVKAILRKINGKNRTEAALWALHQGLEPIKPAAPTARGRLNCASGMAKKLSDRLGIKPEGGVELLA